MHSYREAGAFYRGALDHAGDDALRLDLLCSLVAVQAHEGNVLAARENRERAVALARRLGSGLNRALTAYDAPVTWSIQPGRYVDQPLVDALVEALDGADDETRCRLLATLVFELEGHDDERCRA